MDEFKKAFEAQTRGGFLDAIFTNPIVQFISAALGALGVWKIVDWVRELFRGKLGVAV
jgi:hypothetical protein